MMIRPTNHSQLLLLLFFVILPLTCLESCRYLSIPEKDDVAGEQIKTKGANGLPVYNSAVIKGRIVPAGPDMDSTLVLAYRPADKKVEFTEYTATGANGNTFMLYLPQGRYQLFAVTDYNHNGIYENKETSGLYGSGPQPAEITIREGELITDVEIRTAKTHFPQVKLPSEWRLKKDEQVIRQTTCNGQVLKIYDEYFSLENAQTGYWNPSSFMKAFGAHIYMTEAYNPRKIPVLFVHGTEGTPYNWIYFYMRLDRSRYQPWFFYYPSGIRLNLAADLLNEALRELREKYDFQKMAVVAHSVGGLTTRSFLNRHVSDLQNNFVRLFVSFATPWSGFGLADASRVLRHKSIPVWVDLGTQSEFIQTTMDTRLPATIRHYNFYGKQDRLCGDAAVDHRAVSGAARSLGFDCTHDSILSDRKVFAQFNAILEKELW